MKCSLPPRQILLHVPEAFHIMFPNPNITPIQQHALSLSVTVKVAQSCLTLYDPMDYTIHGILQARILEWVAFPFSRGSSQPRDRTQVSHIAGGLFTS